MSDSITFNDSMRDLASLNPRLAALLLRGDRSAPRAYNYVLRWDTAAAEQYQDPPTMEPMFQDAIVTELRYRVDVPSLAVGSMFKPMIVEAFEKNAGAFILLDLRTTGPDRDQLTEGMTPLGNIASHADSQPKFLTGRNWVFGKDQYLHIRGLNSRAFELGEVPLIVRLTMNVLEFSGSCLKSVTLEQAIQELKERGLR